MNSSGQHEVDNQIFSLACMQIFELIVVDPWFHNGVNLDQLN